MADIQVDDFTDIVAPDGTEVIPTIDERKLTAQKIADLAYNGTGLSALSAIGALDGTELFYVLDSAGLDKKITLATLRADVLDTPTFTDGADTLTLSKSAGRWLLDTGGVTSMAMNAAYGLRLNANTSRLYYGVSEDCVMSRVAAGVLGFHDTASGAITCLEFEEQIAPPAPASNKFRLYAQDNGTGKTQAMIVFSSGAAQQVAIQP